MLKRRASSPPPSSSSSVPLISDSTPMDKLRETKRRRILPPVLDGPMRGWAIPQDALYEDDGEEDIVDDDEPPATGASYRDSPYKSANSFLHELHALQRHRHLFSSHTTSQSPAVHLDRPSEKGPPITGPSTQRKSDDSLFASDLGELDSVRGRYEEMNRLLGSILLSRRRELEPRNDT